MTSRPAFSLTVLELKSPFESGETFSDSPQVQMAHDQAPGILDEYTPSDIHNSIHAVINGLGGLSDDIGAIRESLSDIKTSITTIDLRSQRNEREIFNGDGQSRITLLEGRFERHSLQIKGLWAVVMYMAGFFTNYVMSHPSEGLPPPARIVATEKATR